MIKMKLKLMELNFMAFAQDLSILLNLFLLHLKLFMEEWDMILVQKIQDLDPLFQEIWKNSIEE